MHCNKKGFSKDFEKFKQYAGRNKERSEISGNGRSFKWPIFTYRPIKLAQKEPALTDNLLKAGNFVLDSNKGFWSLCNF